MFRRKKEGGFWKSVWVTTTRSWVLYGDNLARRPRYWYVLKIEMESAIKLDTQVVVGLSLLVRNQVVIESLDPCFYYLNSVAYSLLRQRESFLELATARVV